MIINRDNCFDVGNKAMGAVLFLYYQMINEGGFLNGQTAFINFDDFNAYEFINVQVVELQNETLSINEEILKQGAVISLLCIMHNNITEDDFLPSKNEKIIKLLKEYGVNQIPEISAYLNCVLNADKSLNYVQYNMILNSIYEKYVKDFFVNHVKTSQPKSL